MTHVSVTVGDDLKDSLDGVVESLRARGMQVGQVLASLGIITGEAPADALGALRGVEGVRSVDEEMTYQVAPPDADVQ
jgi:hypothetical protein